jgi:putative transposase
MYTVEVKIYLKSAQEQILLSWMKECCKIYNRALDQRIKAYKRRKESVNYNKQQKLLTEQRSRIDYLRSIPVGFERDALRRVDHGMQMFFKRVKNGKKPGFPRFKSVKQYNSMQYLKIGEYIRSDNFLSIPNLGLVKCRGPHNISISKRQKLLCIIHRASGWYSQVLVDQVKEIKNLSSHGSIGIDMGLISFAALSNGEKIENPRFAKKSEKKQKHLQRQLSRKKKGSNRRKKALKDVQRYYEKVASQRKSFAHQLSTELVRKYPLIAVEKLNITKLGQTKLSKSIMDAGWGIFLNQLMYKAESAGRKLIQVNPAYTSQTCPNCGKIKKKSLSERVHACDCGCVLDRDVAAAMVILSRALDGNRGITGVEEGINTSKLIAEKQICPEKCLVEIGHCQYKTLLTKVGGERND